MRRRGDVSRQSRRQEWLPPARAAPRGSIPARVGRPAFAAPLSGCYCDIAIGVWLAACAAITYRLFYTTVKTLTFKTLSLLAAGEFRSGQDLAAALGVSRGAIWYALRGVDEFGIDIYRVRGRGYRLAQ
ncbi:MAG: HTH domain-containing protein, partial [Betaproteobacteria bacterium]|nr:HTH domain-containing protein [Betaproteobacteria bacterium]